MEDPKQQLIDKLKTANNILVTVSRNPSVDQLSALIGLTLLLNKQGKHAAAVFSGEVPSTLEFLKPDDTIEKNTDSLRDFIISLDKNKADKLRYKVEDNVVRIFITPYKTSISQGDFDFSQGDFNVDLVVAVGVKQQEDLDEAITAHGRILHDATVASINISPDGALGSIIWTETQASSLSELVTVLGQAIDAQLLDDQISTALLTGIVSETNRFSNERTSAQTMSASAALLSAGANQQLVATKLEDHAEKPAKKAKKPKSDSDADKPEADKDEPEKSDDGAIDIKHDEKKDEPDAGPKDSQPETEPELELPKPDDSPGPKLMTEPPTLGGTLTANTNQNTLDPVTDPLSLPQSDHPALLDHQPKLGGNVDEVDEVEEKFQDEPAAAEPAQAPELPKEPDLPPYEPLAGEPADNPEPVVAESTPEPSTGPAPAPASPPQPLGLTPPPPAWVPPQPDPLNMGTTDDGADSVSPAPLDHTLTDLEEAVKSPHLNSARDEVSRALSTSDAMSNSNPQPIQALNAQPFDLNHDDQPSQPDDSAQVIDPNAPPPVPPPIPFQFGNPGQSQNNSSQQ